VEHTNKTIKTMFAQYMGRNDRHWDQQITTLQFVYNTARYEATGYTPAYLNHSSAAPTPTSSVTLQSPWRPKPTTAA